MTQESAQKKYLEKTHSLEGAMQTKIVEDNRVTNQKAECNANVLQSMETQVSENRKTTCTKFSSSSSFSSEEVTEYADEEC